jgi:hypothetical protein
MKFNFRKISAIAASALMAGMTMGVAAAANYPAPFVSGGVANVAVVYGTGAGVSQLDLVQAGNIQDSLGTFVKGGTVTVEGGEAFQLEKTSNKFNFNNSLDGVYATLGSQNLVNFLADGTYKSGNVDEDYTQKITLSDNRLTLFADSDYNSKVPTLGFKWTNGQPILDYDLKFDTAIPYLDLNETDMPLMGKSFYVLSSDASKIVLLDSANKVIVKEGDSVTVGDKTVTIEYIADGKVKFNVDGEITDTLENHGTYELNDGSYIVANDIMYNNKDSGISSVEFSIGAGKISLISGETVEVNDKAVDGLVATFTGLSATGLTNINLAWTSDSKTFLTETDAITMPVFETIKLVFGGMTFPSSSEAVSLDNGETMTLTMGNYELPIFHITAGNSSAATLGDEDFPLVTKTSDGLANYTARSEDANVSVNTGGLDLQENDRFLVTSLDADLSDVETMYYEVNKIHVSGTNQTDVSVELKDLIGTNDLTFDTAADVKSVRDIDVTINQVNDTHVYLMFDGTGISYNTVVSEKGLEVTLPANWENSTSDVGTGVVLTLTEAEKGGDLAKGMPFTATVKKTTNNKLHVLETNVSTLKEDSSSKVEIGYVPSDLASKVTIDKSGDEYDFNVDYYGAEVTADVKVVGGVSTTSTGSNVLGNILVKDSEVSSVATKNLIVVGGSCINSAAAALVGGAKCGAAWTTATGIGTGQFLIKGYATSTLTSGVALLVAGYDAEDTVKATTYLTNKVVDTSKAYKGTTTTETAVVID